LESMRKPSDLVARESTVLTVQVPTRREPIKVRAIQEFFSIPLSAF